LRAIKLIKPVANTNAYQQQYFHDNGTMSYDQLLTARRGFLTKGKLDVVSEGRHIRGHQASGKFAIMENENEIQCANFPSGWQIQIGPYLIIQ